MSIIPRNWQKGNRTEITYSHIMNIYMNKQSDIWISTNTTCELIQQYIYIHIIIYIYIHIIIIIYIYVYTYNYIYNTQIDIDINIYINTYTYKYRNIYTIYIYIMCIYIYVCIHIQRFQSSWFLSIAYLGGFIPHDSHRFSGLLQDVTTMFGLVTLNLGCKRRAIKAWRLQRQRGAATVWDAEGTLVIGVRNWTP